MGYHAAQAEEEVRSSESMPDPDTDVMDGGPAYESLRLYQHQMRSPKLHAHFQDTSESQVLKPLYDFVLELLRSPNETLATQLNNQQFCDAHDPLEMRRVRVVSASIMEVLTAIRFPHDDGCQAIRSLIQRPGPFPPHVQFAPSVPTAQAILPVTAGEQAASEVSDNENDNFSDAKESLDDNSITPWDSISQAPPVGPPGPHVPESAQGTRSPPGWLQSPFQSDEAKILLTLIDEEPDGSPIVQKLENASADIISDIEPMIFLSSVLELLLGKTLQRQEERLLLRGAETDYESGRSYHSRRLIRMYATAAHVSCWDISVYDERPGNFTLVRD
ncbi:MAG: hypothetical protein Q9176_004107 [Flavoplaca citrina]